MLTFKFKSVLLGGACAVCFAAPAAAESFNIPGGDLENALNTYVTQTGVHLIVSEDAIRGVQSRGVRGDLPADQALSRILAGSGFTVRNESGVLAVVRNGQSSDASDIRLQPMQLAQAAPPRSVVETVTVTSSKLGGADVQSIPIAITALSQEQLTATQTAGGPDLIKQVPNMTFTKTNFSGYSIQIRGIGTQAISVTTDPAVAVAFNDMPFIRNHFFEQEFFDVSSVEVLRGPQGTLYGRNATAGVVNLSSARPTDQFEAMASAEIGNYSQRRFEAMLNLPIVDDRIDLRIAGEWTKRQGYSFNSIDNQHIDGRDLWSGRLTLGFKPTERLQTYLVWEHFQEDDDRMRSSKQLCKRADDVTEVNGVPIHGSVTAGNGQTDLIPFLNQGCAAASLYSPDSFQVVNGNSLTYFGLTRIIGNPITPGIDPYGNAVNSRNLRVIESTVAPSYKVHNDVIQLDTDYQIDPSLTLTSQTGFGSDYLWATEDYNRYNTTPGVFQYQDPTSTGGDLNRNQRGAILPDGTFCDPQLGCSDRLIAQDLVKANSWQLNQEFRIASHFAGPFNFSIGGNYMHYETKENYYVFINSLSLLAIAQGRASDPYKPGITDNFGCLPEGGQPGNPGQGAPVFSCIYMDPNPIDKVNDQGHNYFLSQNPYVLNSYAGFGEAYYDVTSTLKLTGGLRWTHDGKHFPLIPSWLLASQSYGYPVIGAVDQDWSEVTGRFAVNWTPKLNFTDQTLVYGSFAHGYKAGGANPPLPVPVGGNSTGKVDIGTVTHPLTFEPEFVNAFEVGSKNTLLDGTLTLNGSAFYYDYKGYQISEIVDRTSVNHNYDAHIMGAELEAIWEPIPGLRFNFSGGYEDARFVRGSKAIDLMDRTAGDPNFMVVKPYPTAPTNCIVPTWVIEAYALSYPGWELCNQYRNSSGIGVTPAGSPTWYLNETPNNGEGIYKDIGNNMMPNAPPFTASLGTQYTLPITPNWAATLRADGYWQDSSYWRIFNDLPYDKLHSYATMNLTLILTNQGGWQVMVFDKNVFNTTAVTGAFLNSDDSGLTTNVFLTDPKLIGVRITKNW